MQSYEQLSVYICVYIYTGIVYLYYVTT